MAMFVVGFKPSLMVFTKFLKSKWRNLENLSSILHDDGIFWLKIALNMMF